MISLHKQEKLWDCFCLYFQGYSNDISEERNQKQNDSILDLDVDGTKGMIIKMIH